MKCRVVFILVMLISVSLFSQEKSGYYTHSDTWQQTVRNSIQSFHRNWKDMQILLKDESRIKLSTWYSVGGFPGERELLHKQEFGPEKNSGLDQVYAGNLKWIARPEWKDGIPHHFPGEAQEATYLQRTITVSEDMELLSFISSDDGLHVWLNGHLILENNADRGLEPNQEYVPLRLEKGNNLILLKINNRGGRQGYYFSMLPDAEVYAREIERIWVLTKHDFTDSGSRFQIEREQTDGIWDSQVEGYNEKKLIKNYLEKIELIPLITEYSKAYLAAVKSQPDVDVISELYYLSCKFDNVVYLDDANEPDDVRWEKYKKAFEQKAAAVASLLTRGESSGERLEEAKQGLENLFSKIPLKLPSGPDSNEKFGAYYTTLKYDLDWDKHWRIGDYADVVVTFPGADYKFVFWRGTSYIPCWVTDTGVWYTNEFVERRGFHSPNTEGCVEPMSDKQCRYSHVRIIENSDARVVIHWRYAPIDVHYEHPFTDPVTGWSDWVDEVYTLYPFGVGVRKITVQTNRPDLWMEFQEAIVINQPGTMPEDNIEAGAISLANMAGQSKTYYWTEQGGPEFEEGPEHASIFKVNLKAAQSPFALVAPPEEEGNLITSYLGHAPTSIFNFWDHWPVSQDASDGRVATSAIRPSHSSLGHIGLPGNADMEWIPYEAGKRKQTKIMLHGMTDKAAEALVPLAKSWLNPPQLTVRSNGFSSAGYDPTQAAYVIENNQDKAIDSLSFTLSGNTESPIINPAIVIRDWCAENFELKINGKRMEEGSNYFVGFPVTVIDKEMVVWMEYQTETKVTIELQAVK
jgi:hypothetical protein